MMKLKHKSRNGARVHKVYDTAQTPYHRLLEYDVLTSEQRMTMQRPAPHPNQGCIQVGGSV